MKRQSTPCRTRIRLTGLFTKLLVRLEETRLWSYGIGAKHAVVGLIKRQSTACYTRIRSHGVFTKSMVLWWQVQPTSKKGRKAKVPKAQKKTKKTQKTKKTKKAKKAKKPKKTKKTKIEEAGLEGAWDRRRLLCYINRLALNVAGGWRWPGPNNEPLPPEFHTIDGDTLCV